MLAAYLSVGRPIVERIKIDYRTRTLDQVYQLLLAWKKEHGNRATCRALFTSMRECDTVSIDWAMLNTKLGFSLGKCCELPELVLDCDIILA